MYPSEMRTVLNATSPGAQWGIHWKYPFLMVLFFVFSVICALGHHILYQFLDGQVPKHQDWYIRAGTAFAVISKILLTASVGIAFAQRAWRTARSNYLSLNSLDSLFGAASDPLALLNFELLADAKVALALTILIWLSPLITIFTPGSLTTIQQTVATRQLLTVPTINMTLDDLSGNGSAGTLDFFTTTTVSGKQVLRELNGPSNAALAIIYQTIYQGRVVNANSPCGNQNCSFEQAFGGPTYQCEDVDIGNMSAPWCQLSTTSNSSCTLSEQGGFDNVLYSVNNGSVNGYDDGNIWVLYRYYPPDSRNHSVENGVLSSLYQNISFRCTLWDTWFNVRRNFVNAQQEIEANLTHISPIDLSSTSGNTSQWGAVSIHLAVVPIFRNTLSQDFIPQLGWEWMPEEGLTLAGTPFVERTPWPKPLDWLPGPNFKQQLEEMSRNITLSMFSLDNLSYLRMQNNTGVDITTFETTYSYDKRALLVTYGIAVALGLLAMGIGIKSFLDNGVSMRVGFLPIMATTRNPNLDELVGGHCLGADGTMDEFKDVKVKFGQIRSNQRRDTREGEPVRYAFGLVTETIRPPGREKDATS